MGTAYSLQESLEVRFPKMASSVQKIISICNDDALAPFEKSIQVREVLDWMKSLVFPFEDTNSTPVSLRRSIDWASVILLTRLSLESPSLAALGHLGALSIPVYEEALKVASLSCYFALTLDYCEIEFLRKFVETVFLAEVGLFSENITTGMVDASLGIEASLSSEEQLIVSKRYLETISRIRSGSVPGLKDVDQRLGNVLATFGSEGEVSDPLVSIVALSRWFARNEPSTYSPKLPWHNSAFQKIAKALDLSVLSQNLEEAA